MNDGGIVCKVRKDLLEILLEMKKMYTGVDKIDYILIETKGMTDPMPIFETFLLNEEIQEWAKIDSCLTICDVSKIKQKSVKQVCFADKVFLNKVDLADRETLDAATKKIREHNTQAIIEEVQFNNDEKPLSKTLDLNMFSI